MSGASSIKSTHKLRKMIPMKKIYSQPELTVHGNVEALTQAVGPKPVQDFIIIGGVQQGVPTDGSGDFVI